MSQYYTIYDVAELLQVSDDQVRKLISAGELATISLSMPGSKRNCVRISQHQLDAFIDSRTMASPRSIGKSPDTMAQLPPVTKWV
ncbi:MAG: helix-turn-helix domain-containing protein [Planctomycetota bacterium]|nr:helix-turn-helix domain-containing protein [Planctomycetota bacterium]